ncbi:MAG: phosphoribosylaminoimidazole carboxylase [Planctomycetaceae bacterium]|nr:phosphoribosylaminoimidazole carboxylase [Planctomycetaceae bacterium]
MSRMIEPGAAIGVLGSGQLGRMFAIAARKMGYRVHTYSPDDDTPTGQVADLEVNAAYEDLDRVREFASNVKVVTFEFENVPAATTAAAAERTIVRPRGEVLHVTQNRLREKTFLQQSGFPVAPFRTVRSATELVAALQELGCPAVLKTAGWGYDGKGQAKITDPSQADAAWRGLNTSEGVLEGFIQFEREVSVVAARGADGEFVHYGVIDNRHQNHILDISVAPAEVPDAVTQQAVELAREVLEKLDVVGVLCVEFFLTHNHQLIINELAPRPHNSGHLTFDACVTSQFEQQLRAICGLPLGSTELLRPAAMANLLGDLWFPNTPNWGRALSIPDVKLNLYGKLAARPGRKMGHLTAMAATQQEAIEKVIRARELLATP